MTSGPFIRFAGILVCFLVAQQSNRKKRTRQKRKSIYSRSQRNVVIDSLVHPLANEHWSFVIVDGVLHALNEEDPIQSLIKFLRYNAPELLKRILRETR